MLKQGKGKHMKSLIVQPPSGGCVLKLCRLFPAIFLSDPAAFGRLCVETFHERTFFDKYGTSRLRAAVC